MIAPQLPIARYRFHAQATTRLRLQDYSGSELRGAFGHALRALACVTSASTCDGCTLLQRCPYPAIFEAQKLPVEEPGRPAGAQRLAPYCIEPGSGSQRQFAAGERLFFDMVLIGQPSIKQLPLLTAAWQRALIVGLGVERDKARLCAVDFIPADPKAPPQPVLQEGSRQLQAHEPGLIIPQFYGAADAHLNFVSPLRLVQAGQLIGLAELTPSVFLRQLIRRVNFQVGQHLPDWLRNTPVAELNAMADGIIASQPQMAWREWDRYSSRQRRKMKFGGLVGQWHLHQIPAPLQAMLYLGQWLHVGKETAFGLGHYQWLKESVKTEHSTAVAMSS